MSSSPGRAVTARPSRVKGTSRPRARRPVPVTAVVRHRGSPPSLTWTRNSSRNIEMAEAMDEGMEGPSTQMVVCWGGQPRPGGCCRTRPCSRSRSSSRPGPVSIRYRIRSSQPEPSRHGVHWPQDSRGKNLVIRQAARTTQVVVVHDHDRARAEHRAGLADLVLAERQVEVLGTEPGRRDPAGDEGLQVAAAADPAAEHRGVDEVAEGGLRPSPPRRRPGCFTWPASANSRVPVERPCAQRGEGGPAVGRRSTGCWTSSRRC